MAVKFLEPSGDLNFNALATSSGGIWGVTSGSPVVATDFVHGAHLRSIKYGIGGYGSWATTATGTAADAGGRVSAYVYFNALPSTSRRFIALMQSNDSTPTFCVNVTNTGVLQMWNGSTAQIGSNGPTISTGTWYRISLAYTITSTTVNRAELFLNGVSAVSITNATLSAISTNRVLFGNNAGDTTMDMRSSDHYVDDSTSLTDMGDVWVTAKRPVSNGTLNEFTTQVGSGGSGYGSGHTPQVNERPISVTNAWRFSVSGTAKTEEYTVEAASVGDIDISTATIVDSMGWIIAASSVSETGLIIVAGSTFNVSLTSGIISFVQIAGSSSYPAGGTDIGLKSTTATSLVTLYECGLAVAYIPLSNPTVSVSDALTCTESVTVRISSFISVSEALTATEAVTVQKILLLSVTDSLTVSEAVAIQKILLISVSDALTCTESTVILMMSFVSISDTLAITESVIAFVQVLNFSVSTSDALTVTESRSQSIGGPDYTIDIEGVFVWGPRII